MRIRMPHHCFVDHLPKYPSGSLLIIAENSPQPVGHLGQVGEERGGIAGGGGGEGGLQVGEGGKMIGSTRDNIPPPTPFPHPQILFSYRG